MDIINSEFYFRFNFANQYALLWTPNAYRDTGYTNEYFYALLIFPMRFYQFSMRNYALKLHSHQTPDQPPLNPDQFL